MIFSTTLPHYTHPFGSFPIRFQCFVKILIQGTTGWMSEFGALAHSLADGDVSTVMSWQAIETWDTAQLCTVNWWCGSFLPPFCQNITLIHTFNCYLHQLFHYWFNYYIICMTVIPRIFLGRILNWKFRFSFSYFFLFFFFIIISCQSSPPTPSLNSFWCTHTSLLSCH